MDYYEVIEASREYLMEVGMKEWEVLGMENHQILSKVNMLYFGGIQAFVRKIEERCRSPSSTVFPIT